MTIAFTILMMWWDWPNARQCSGTDEKTWLTGFLYSLSSVCVCVCLPSCRGIVSLLTVLKYITAGFHLKIYLCICTMVPLLNNHKTCWFNQIKSFNFIRTDFEVCALQMSLCIPWFGRSVVWISARSHVWVMLCELSAQLFLYLYQ